MHKFDFGEGWPQTPLGGELTALPRPFSLAEYKEPTEATSKGREERKDGREGQERGRREG